MAELVKAEPVRARDIAKDAMRVTPSVEAVEKPREHVVTIQTFDMSLRDAKLDDKVENA
ncbi:MAG TPA: hypothetical protein VF515_06755 [Candidatus Binatia bacterium]